jgi:hypothetical protein
MSLELTTATEQQLSGIRQALKTVSLIGDETISGVKTFDNDLYLKDSLLLQAEEGRPTISGKLALSLKNQGTSSITLEHEDGDAIYLSSPSIYLNNSNNIRMSSRPYVNGTGILLSGDTMPLPNTVVLTTGNQIISGIKTFEDNINISGDLTLNGGLYINDIEELNLTGANIYAQIGSFNTLQVKNKKISSYNYSTNNFIFGDNYVNLTNSSTTITGTLPIGITSGINYYVKNLNTGILLITGSGQRTIDGFSTVNLYKNESLQLLGVNNQGYTGWVTLSADNGVS